MFSKHHAFWLIKIFPKILCVWTVNLKISHKSPPANINNWHTRFWETSKFAWKPGQSVGGKGEERYPQGQYSFIGFITAYLRTYQPKFRYAAFQCTASYIKECMMMMDNNYNLLKRSFYCLALLCHFRPFSWRMLISPFGCRKPEKIYVSVTDLWPVVRRSHMEKFRPKCSTALFK
jgi:hypothetical protein